jgi:hypothetical protein
MQRGAPLINPAHQRDPRLAGGCHVAIRTGYRPSPTPIEQSWLDSFAPISRIRTPCAVSLSDIANTSAEQSELEFVREPGVALERIFCQVGRSADGAALIFCHAQLYLVPVADVVGFRAERRRPAKGSGGSSLKVEWRTHHAGLATKRLTISSAEGPDDLNELTRTVATAIGKPFELGEYLDDV